jgi:uncharacterized protein
LEREPVSADRLDAWQSQNTRDEKEDEMATLDSSKTQALTSVQEVLSVPLDPWPISADSIRDGQPQASGMVIARSDDRRAVTGVWECTPGSFDWHYIWDETASVVAGRVTISEKGGASQTFKAGDVVHCPLGLQTTWTVHETVRKVYTLISPIPLDL